MNSASTEFKILIGLLIFLISFNLSAQSILDFGFTRSYTIPVMDSGNINLKNAWAGGLNACQYNTIDLNLDGINDLVIFDRHGNRLLTFENNGISNQISYVYKPEYENAFPKINDWIIIADYNGDGLDDIFSYSLGYAGIKVHKNTSSAKLQFETVVPKYLKSKQGAGFTNILVTYADYPAIIDLDRDGDLDILTFWGLGLFIELHKNMSIETYGNADSLLYEKVNYCWGEFAESPESNVITLDTCLNTEQIKNEPKHTGSTFLVQDLNGDGLDDLLLGDVDYPNVVKLTNGGTPETAKMIAQTTVFPEETPLNLTSFPILKSIDVNNDQKKDLLVSTFDPSLVKSETTNSSWLYLNSGSNNTPDYLLSSKQFIQDQMIDVGAASMPVLHDLDADGLLDLFIGNFGVLDTAFYDEYQILQCHYRSTLAYYKNTGTKTDPIFKLTNPNFLDIASIFPDNEPITGIFPTFGDLDGDGDSDLVVGNANGQLLYFENQTISNEFPLFQLISDHYQQIDVGMYSAPQLIDLTGDNLLDLAIGNQNGTLHFYRNTGTLFQPEFTFTTDSLGKVSVRDPNLSYNGYTIPCFFKGKNNKTNLIVGSESGKIYYYKDIENNLLGQFTKTEDAFSWIHDGIRSAPALADINEDGYMDLIVGNYSGGLTYYQGKTPSPFGINFNSTEGNCSIEVFPNPSSDQFMIHFPDLVHLLNVQLISIFGKTIEVNYTLELTYNDEYHISLPDHVPSGVYFIRIKFLKDNRQWTSTKKLIIKKLH